MRISLSTFPSTKPYVGVKKIRTCSQGRHDQPRSPTMFFHSKALCSTQHNNIFYNHLNPPNIARWQAYSTHHYISKLETTIAQTIIQYPAQELQDATAPLMRRRELRLPSGSSARARIAKLFCCCRRGQGKTLLHVMR